MSARAWQARRAKNRRVRIAWRYVRRNTTSLDGPRQDYWRRITRRRHVESTRASVAARVAAHRARANGES